MWINLIFHVREKKKKKNRRKVKRLIGVWIPFIVCSTLKWNTNPKLVITRLKREIEKKSCFQTKWIMDRTMKNGKISSVSFRNNLSNVWFIFGPNDHVEFLVEIFNAWYIILINISHMQFFEPSSRRRWLRTIFFFPNTILALCRIHFESIFWYENDHVLLLFFFFFFRYIKWLYIKIENT